MIAGRCESQTEAVRLRGDEIDVVLMMDAQNGDIHAVLVGAEAPHPLDARFWLYR